MPNATSLLSYNDIKEVLEKALAAENGLRLGFKTTQAAVRWLSRANSFRLLDRKANAKLYPEGNTLHNASPYDVLFMKRDGPHVELKILKNEDLSIMEI